MTIRRAAAHLSVTTMFIVCVCSSGTALAQSDENRAAARAITAQGISAEEAGKWAEAAELFTRAEALYHAPPHVLHIARAEAKRGRLVAAQERYLKVTREELSPSAPRAFVDAQSAANDELAALQPRIPGLKIVLEGGTGHVTLDGAPVADALVGVEFPIDPGKHELRASGKGLKSAPVFIEVAEGRHEVARLVLEASAEPVSGTPLPAGEVGPDSVAPSRGPNIPAYVALGAGAAGLVVGTAMMLVNRGKRDDADALCPSRCPQSKKAEIDDLDASADSAKTISLIGYGVGVVGLGVGAVFLLMKKAPAASAASGAVRPWAGTGSYGLSGSF